jgi:hypothetical protein
MSKLFWVEFLSELADEWSKHCYWFILGATLGMTFVGVLLILSRWGVR